MFDRINPLIIFVVVVVFAFFILFRQVKALHYRMDDLEQDLADLHNAQAFCSKPMLCGGKVVVAASSDEDDDEDEDDDTSEEEEECLLSAKGSGHGPMISALYMSADTTPVCVIKEEEEEECTASEEEAAEDEPAPAPASTKPRAAPAPKARAPPKQAKKAAQAKKDAVKEACEIADGILSLEA